MKHKKTVVILGLLLLLSALLAGGWYWIKHRAAPDAAEPAAPAVSALVQTQKIEQKPQDLNLQVFGDVSSDKIISLSFPQAGQLTLLPVLPGQQVHQGDELANLTIDPNTQAAFAQAASAASFARAEMQRQEALFGLNMLTQSQLDTAHRQLQDAEAILAAQKKLGGDTAMVKLIATKDGVIVALSAAQGDRIAAGAPVLQLGESKNLRIQFGIEPGQRQLVHPGMKVTLSTLQDPTQTVSARLTEVQTVVDPKTQLINAILRLPSTAAGAITAGMRVQGVINLGQQLVWLAPRHAVLNDDQGWYLFQISDGQAHRIKVSKVMETTTQIGVQGEIHPDWPLVVMGNYELEDKMAVRQVSP